MSIMSMNNLSIDGELRYIIQWFNEWSELQRDDFVPVLVEYLLKDVPTASTGSGSSVYMNGIVHTLTQTNVNDKPMSLFQCRIKLFRQWNPKWPHEFKEKLKQKIGEIDPKVGEKINGEINKQNNENGNSNGCNGDGDYYDVETFETQMNATTPNAAESTARVTTAAVPTFTTENVQVNDAKQVNVAPTTTCTSTITTIDTAPTVTHVGIASTTAQTSEAIDVETNIAAVLRNETPVDDQDDYNVIVGVVQAQNEVQDNVTRVTLNADIDVNAVVDINNRNDDDTVATNAYNVVEPVPQQQQLEHVTTNATTNAVTVSVTTNAEVPLLA